MNALFGQRIPLWLVSSGDFLRRHLDWVAGVLIALLLMVGGGLAVARHNSFHTFVYDLGFYLNALWNTAHGHLFVTRLDTRYPLTILSDHFSPMLAVLAPFIWAAPDARVLILFYVIVISLSIIPAYLLLRDRYPILAVALVAAFVVNLVVQRQMVAEFHDVVMAVPCLTLALYAFYRDRMPLLLIALGLTLLVREDMGIIVSSFGVFMMIRRPDRRWLGLGITVAGLVWMAAVVLIVQPYSSYMFLPGAKTGKVGTNTAARLVTTTAQRFVKSLSYPGRSAELASIAISMAGLIFLADGEQILWLPTALFLIVLASSTGREIFSYHIAPLVPLLWASIARFMSRLKPRAAWASMALLLTGSMVGFRAWSPLPGGLAYQPDDTTVTPHDQIGDQVVAMIPPDASVAAQDGIGVHLAARPELYLYPWYDKAHPPDMIVLDTTSPLHYPLRDPEDVSKAVVGLQLDPKMQLFWEQDGYYVFHYDPAVQVANKGDWQWSPWLQLDGYELAQTNAQGATISGAPDIARGGTIRISLYWTALKAMPTNYTVSVLLHAPDGFVVAQDDAWPGRGTLPTDTLKEGQSIRDVHYLALPPGRGSEDLRLDVVVYDLTTLKRLDPQDGYTLTVFKAK